MARGDHPAGVVDLTQARAAEDRRAKFREIDELLIKSDRQAILPTVSNLIIILGKDPTFEGMFGFDDFDRASPATVLKSPPPPLGDMDVPGPYPRPWDGVDVSFVQSYVQRSWNTNVGPENVSAAMAAVAAGHRYHPVRDWLATLRHDGVERIDTWLHKAFGAPEKDPYTIAVGSKFLIAAVRRVRQPGVKFDHMPVLEGFQDMGKSTAVAALFGSQWFADSIPAKLETPDAALALQGVWCVEFAEIEQIIRSEVEVIKAFLSRSTDRFRAPYGRGFLRYPRQCVLIGTTNDTDYLRDATGNRRFWPIQCKRADVAWITDNREQLWAEAAAAEALGDAHWITERVVKKSATEHQSDRMQEDPWRDRIVGWCSQFESVIVPDILTMGLSIPLAQQGKREQMRVAAVLRSEGWLRKLARDSAQSPSRRWVRTTSEGEN